MIHLLFSIFLNYFQNNNLTKKTEIICEVIPVTKDGVLIIDTIHDVHCLLI